MFLFRTFLSTPGLSSALSHRRNEVSHREICDRHVYVTESRRLEDKDNAQPNDKGPINGFVFITEKTASPQICPLDVTEELGLLRGADVRGRRPK